MVLYLTHCCREKNPGGELPPRELYRSGRIEDFIDFCMQKGRDWAVLSAEHGIVTPEEKHERYDTTFRSEGHDCRYVVDNQIMGEMQSRQKFQRTARKVRKELEGVDRVVFYTPDPRSTRCYLLLLHAAADSCTDYHGTVEDIRDCMGETGNVKLVTSREQLEKAVEQKGKYRVKQEKK